jgi:hypothetical protein
LNMPSTWIISTWTFVMYLTRERILVHVTLIGRFALSYFLIWWF